MQHASVPRYDFEMLIEDDVIYLQQQEEKLASIEEELLKKIPEHFYEIILQYRKRFRHIMHIMSSLSIWQMPCRVISDRY